MIEIEFKSGTLVLDGPEDEMLPLAPYCTHDSRIGKFRARACEYAAIVTHLHSRRKPYRDEARAYAPLSLTFHDTRSPRGYQADAVSAWFDGKRRGVVVLPTGSGKSFVAHLAIARTQRPTLVVVPTIDLLQQWATQLESAFGCEVGMLGGGSREVRDLTVSTYDSAALMMEFIGNRFGLLIVDECHHLPGPTNQTVASMCIAPFRMGLTATPERDDDGEAVVEQLLGPVCFRRGIHELEGRVLSPYRTVRLGLELDPDELADYERERAVYMGFVRANRINFGDPKGWVRFVGLCARKRGGRDAFNAYLAQKRIARSSRAKFRTIWSLLREHAGERVLIFTADNRTAYDIGEAFVLPVLTHHTKVQERKAFLDAFRSGQYSVLVTSRVLNEGIDVPEASVGIVVSGSGSTREHVQRLGRLLRPVAEKQACLYELVSRQTSESYVSDRRRKHRAYQRSH